MATYAGFQKYDTPNLGQDAANMLIAKQQMDARKAQQESENAYKNMELGIKLQKEQRDALSANEKVVNESISKVSEAANKIPQAGYASMPTALTAMVSKARDKYGEFARRADVSSTEKSIMQQQYIDVFSNFQQTGEIVKVANESFAKAKDPDTLAQFVLHTSSLPASPNPDNTVELDIEESGGRLLPKVKSYQKNENGELELTQSIPLEQINAIATIGNYEAPNYRKQAEEMFKSLGVSEVDVVQRSGAKKTIINPKAQENFKKTKEDYINLVMMNNAGDAYMKLVKSATDPADYLMEGATDAQRKNVAMSQGVENVEDANIIYVSRNSKLGGFNAKLTPQMEEKLRSKLGEVFDNMSPYKVDETSPNVTRISTTTINEKDDSIGRGYDDAARLAKEGDFSALNDYITFGKVNGSINPEDNVLITVKNPDGSPKMQKVKNAEGKVVEKYVTKTVPTFTYDYKNNKAKIWIIKSNDEPEQITIDLNKPSDVRTKLGMITGVRKLEEAHDATQAKYRKVPVNVKE